MINNDQGMKITPARGRPMLNWVGKRPITSIVSRPAQLVETFEPIVELTQPEDKGSLWEKWPATDPKSGLLFYGDNKEVLANLIASGFRDKIDLIYIDPPFDSGADYVRKVTLRGVKGFEPLEGEGQSIIEQIQYEDIWTNDSYLQFMYERLILLKELLSSEGSIFLHVDEHKG